MHFFKSRFIILFVMLPVLYFSGVPVSAAQESIIKNVIKIKTYESQSDGSFVFRGYGSAIAISSSRILTNAHVILDPDGEPTGLYEVCFSVNFENVPICRESARLIAYDTVSDLALLELAHTNTLAPFVLASSKIALGSYVSMYGYPRIGGETITRTEGKIAGYEQLMYKIDGSIDHGNSGGGAFNNSGELVGIPTAVAADNASIGYMIPIQRIQSFLAKKTNNYEAYTHSPNREFNKYLHRIQLYRPNKNILTWNDITVKNSHFYGFSLKSSMVSSDNTMMNWIFSDPYERVKVTISCTNDAGGITGWQARKNGLKKEQETYPNWQMKMANDDKYLTIYSSSKGYDPSVVLYYKEYDACFGEIDYIDEKKDARLLQKAFRFLKQGVTFRAPYTLKDSQKNHFFEIKDIQNDTRVIRSIDQFGAESTLIGIEITPGQWVNAIIEGKEYTTLQEISQALNVDFEENKTWKQYIDTGVKNGINPSNIHPIRLGSDQKGLLYTRYNTEKKSTNIDFEYIYTTKNNGYAFWNWSAMIPGELTVGTARMENIFASLIYPGQSLLQD